jgi:hypothetical protein
MAGRRVSAISNEINIRHNGAVSDGRDNGAAMIAAVANLQPFDTLIIPDGKYLTSQKITVSKQNYRVKCDGIVGPHGSFDDYLFEFTRPDGFNLSPGLQSTCNIESLPGGW